jgi:hypothetical protein
VIHEAGFEIVWAELGFSQVHEVEDAERNECDDEHANENHWPTTIDHETLEHTTLRPREYGG